MMNRPAKQVLAAILTAAPAALAPASHAQPAAQTQTLNTTVFAIENMFCAMCPVTVRLAMQGVEGVRSVTVDYEARTATVVYDTSLTSAEAIANASTTAGYPANVQS